MGERTHRATEDKTYRREVVEQPGQVGDDAVNVLVLLDEAVALAVGDFANDIKGVELQPARKVAALGAVDEDALRLVQEELGRVVDKGLVLHKLRHGKGRVDAAPELGVEVIVGRAEQALQRAPFDDRLLHHVEAGLQISS